MDTIVGEGAVLHYKGSQGGMNDCSQFCNLLQAHPVQPQLLGPLTPMPHLSPFMRLLQCWAKILSLYRLIP